MAVSEATANDLVERYGIAPREKVRVIRLGVPEPQVDVAAARRAVRDEFGLGPTAPVVLLAGRLEPVKAPRLALDVLARVRRSHGDAVLLMAGGGEPPRTGTGRDAGGRARVGLAR